MRRETLRQEGADIPQRRVRALRIEAEPIDDAAVGIEPEHPRPRIAGRLRW